MSAEIAKFIEDLKGIISILDPEGKIKVTRTEALEWWDKARIANKRYIRKDKKRCDHLGIIYLGITG